MKPEPNNLPTWLLTTDSNVGGRRNHIPPPGETIYGPRKCPFSYPNLLSSDDCFEHLWWGFGPILHKMVASGDIEEKGDMVYSSELQVIESVDMSADLRLFACKCCREMPIGDGRVFSDLFPSPLYSEYVSAVEGFAKGELPRSEPAKAKDSVDNFIYQRDKTMKDIALVFELPTDSFVESLIHERPERSAAYTVARTQFCAPREHRQAAVDWAKNCFYDLVNSRFHKNPPAQTSK